MSKLLETKELVTNFYTYEGVVKALDKVSISIDHGETFGLVGESGCGKSVTVRSVMRIIQSPGVIEGGEVQYCDDADRPDQCEDLLVKSEEEMRELRGDRISMIFQEPNAALNPVLTIGDQVAESYMFHRKRSMSKQVLEDVESGKISFGVFHPFLKWAYGRAAANPKDPVLKWLSKLPLLKYWDKPMRREAINRSIRIIEKLGISNAAELVTRYPHNLSGGMKQRIVIAIALACNPTLLIADEATSNLDVTIQAQILGLLNDLKERKAISSVLLITHDLGVVAETCDRVGVMYAGTLCEVADVKTLFNKPIHPYTRALLNSVPRFCVEGELATIEGSVPNLVHPPEGCRFHPRCKQATDICKREKPRLVDLGDGHSVACHNIDHKIGE
ncbi:ABC transporter ATP-binding protein [Salidesulfovibrio onnuriiensis]|uniref:ABC transporter ATP-binding protein n=1 Tax=Salidesulfovibrio onnuriiensis TaxID=2583823 RepID=UPI0011CA79AA|nr:ABC transporter ATP-binding protein [Salidesulfovibrio onnuriiensis]